MARITDFYFIDIEDLSSRLAEKGYRRILLEAPNGLKQFMPEMAREIEEACGCRVYIRGGHVYGACDIGYGDAEAIGADAIVHIGHNEYPRKLYTYTPRGIPVVYVEAASRNPLPRSAVLDAVEILRKHGVRSVGLLASIQHIHLLGELRKNVESLGFEAVIGKPAFTEMKDGQVLGCEYSSARSIASRVEGFIVVSGGMFHALGAYLSTRKPVVKVDPYRGEAADVVPEGEMILRKRYAVIMRALDSENWAIIMGSKSGQLRVRLANVLEARIREKGFMAYRIILGNLDADILRNMDAGSSIDAFIVTSCPRIPIDDLGDYEKPVLTPGEAFMVLDERLEEYRFPW